MNPKSAAKRAQREERNYLDRVRPHDWKNPEPQVIYDLAILGAGPAGIEAAETAARAGFKVALIERNRLGGNSLNAGSIPSKAVIRTANVYAQMHDADEFGAPMPTEPAVDFTNVMARMRAIRSRIGEYHTAPRFARIGVDLFFGEACFTDRNAIAVAGAHISFRKALIATGARPRPSNIPGLDMVGYRTSDSIFDMTALPKRIAVIGGGPLGCEIAQALRRLGPQVTILQNDAKFLPREERDAAEILSRSMARCGVEIRLNTTVTGARKGDNGVILKTYNNDIEVDLETDQVLLSIGRVPNLDGLGLDKAHVAYDAKRGIIVDDFLCTANPDIYAAGDVCMALKFTNAAQASAQMAVENALCGGKGRHDALMIPWCTYCDPEIAHIGLHIWEARRDAVPIRTFTVMMHDIDRAVTDSQDGGFIKIHVAQHSDKILGATITASHASEMINEVSVLMNAGIGMMALARMPHAYPTQSQGILLAARAFMSDKSAGACSPGRSKASPRR
ncbi:MAG: mercuric reductase [Alphaproteobacteria bacterium]|nr:mercuric reductase [Alphaproteobacteria bacterium]